MPKQRIRWLISAVIAVALVATPLFGGGQAALADNGSPRLLVDKDYFPALHKALREAKDSVYVAMYIIGIPDKEDTANPASVLVDDLVNAKARGVKVKVVLDDTKFNISYNAFKRLKQAGIDVHLDSPASVLHGKGVVIDNKLCFIGSTNWTRASIEDNREFTLAIDSPELARQFIDYACAIKLSPDVPVFPQSQEGVNLSGFLLTSKDGLAPLLTSHAEKAFDLYLYLLKKTPAAGPSRIRIDYKELARYLGYTGSYYFSVRQPLNALVRKYRLVSHRPWSKYLTLKTGLGDTPDFITIPGAYWLYGFDKRLSFPAKYMYLASLLEAGKSDRNPYWFRSIEDLARLYHIGERTVSKGIKELENENILEVYRQKPPERGKFEDRPANIYRLNVLISDEDFNAGLKELSAEYGEEAVRRACALSAELNDPKDIAKLKVYIGLINTYGYEKVKQANSEAASKRLETGFRTLDHVILLLKQ